MSNKSKLKDFNIEMVNKLGGCKPAMKYLREKYGEEVIDLGNRRADFIDIMDEGKADWIINFCLNIMQPQERKTYLEYVLLDLSFQFSEDDSIKKPIKLLIRHICKQDKSDSEIENYDVMFQNRLSNLESVYIKNEAEEDILKRVIEIRKIKAMQTVCENYKKNFIKACVMSSLHSCEAIVARDIIEDSTQNICMIRRIKMKEYGLYAMKLTELWPNE